MSELENQEVKSSVEESKVSEMLDKVFKDIPKWVLIAFMLVALGLLVYSGYLLYLTKSDPVGMAEKLGYQCVYLGV